MTKGNQFYRVNSEGDEAKSILTNSARLAKIIEASNCSNSGNLIREIEKEIKGDDWERDERGFEQHMLEENQVRVDWKNGKFEQQWLATRAATRMHEIKCVDVARSSAMER